MKRTKPTRFRLPTPLILICVIAYTLAVYFLADREKVALPEEETSICLYSNQAGDSLQKTFTQAIRGAKSSVVCLIYSLSDEEIIAALKDRADAGVDVLVICDAVATQDAASKLGPRVRVASRRMKGLMHNKLLAIDERQAWLGSANFTSDSVLLHANLVMGINSREVAQAITEKAHLLEQKKSRRITPLVLKTPSQELSLSFLPDDVNALDTVVEHIQTAQKTVKVAMFTFTHPKLINALVEAHKRGVQVDIVLDSDSSRKTSSQAYKRFQKEKMSVLVSHRKGLLHEKVAILDDDTLIMGSANWTKAAFTANDENLCILKGLTPPQKQKLDAFWSTTLRESKR